MNRNHLLILFTGFLLMSWSGFSQGLPWVNEFHYDNKGADTGEFVEVGIPNQFEALTDLRLTLYNGGNGKSYGESFLLSDFDSGETSDGYRIVSRFISGLQNGSPDGFALDVNGELVEFISYEGSFTAISGPAEGRTSTDVVVIQTGSGSSSGSLGLTGAIMEGNRGIWSEISDASPGLFNSGQLIEVVPEPGMGLLVLVGSLLMVFKRPGVG
ncbi:MAG TPA: hypothetical protein EYQ50_02405 [Verrucomicrobiales bacterium]|nr:hypothetical protein [Verrucomicrobiales bacterium]HIL70846.1 hypothetical protein [Verrucomicrobiota bacterium]